MGDALETTNAATAPAVVAKLLLAQSRLDYQLERYKESFAAAERALIHYRQLADPIRIAEAQGYLGSTLITLGRICEGEAALEAALKDSSTWGQVKLSGAVLRGLGVARSLSNDRSGAHARFTAALAAARSAGADRDAALAMTGLAEVEFHSGDVETALGLANEALELHRKFNRTSLIAGTLNNIAAYYVTLNRYREASLSAREALLLSRDAQYVRSEVQSLLALQHLAAITALQSSDSARSGDMARAARILGFVEARWTDLALPREYTEQQELERALRRLHTLFAEPQLTSLMDDGTTLGEDRAVAEGLALVE